MTGYNDYYVTADPGIKFFTDNPGLDSYYNYLHTTEEEIDKDEYYSWLQGAGGTRYYLANTFKIGERYSVIATAQRDKKIGHAQQEDIDLLKKIGPHLQRAVQINQLFKEADLRVAAAYDALESLPYGVFLFSHNGKIIYLNAIGRKAIANNDGLVFKDGQIKAIHPDEDSKLQALIGGIITQGSGGVVNSGGDVAISSKTIQYRYFLQVIPLSHTLDLVNPQRPAGMIMLGDPSRNIRIKAGQLRVLFGLTPAESRIALHLSGGSRQEDICDSLNISINTLKTHRRHVLDKTGVKSQAELILLLHSI